MLSCAVAPACPASTARPGRAASDRLPALHQRLCVPTRVHAARRRTLQHAVRASAEGGVPPAAPRAADRSEAANASILRLTDELRLLEGERDEAVAVAEAAAASAVKLEEMRRLLEGMAAAKVADGDDDGARSVLQEKAVVHEVLARASDKSKANYALAAKLAEKIGQMQAQLMQLLTPPGSSSPSNSASRASEEGFDVPIIKDSSASGAAYTSSSSSSSSSSRASSSSSSSSSSSAGFYEPPWERSLREARERLAAAEAQAAAAGAAASSRARESIEEARDRLRQASFESIDAARSRLRRSAGESIAAARARIAAEDAAVLAEVRRVVQRYKEGSYVPEAELDWAFAQLERRAWR